MGATILGRRRPCPGYREEVAMKMQRLFVVSLATLGMAGFSLAASADAAAGKAKFTSVCGECHEAADFEGEAAADVGAKIKKIIGGQTKHKKALKLTDQQISDVAAFMASGGK